MGGLFVLVVIGIWFVLAFKFSGWISNKYFKQGTTSRMTIRVLLTCFLIILPFMDQLIAYPKWQQMCKTTGDFEWGPNMNEKTALGRELIVFSSIHETTTFPNIHVTYFSRQFKDAQTGELVLNMPHASYYKAKGMFYLPSDSGDNQAIFLSECTTKDKDQKIINYLNQFNLKVVEYKN